MSCVSLSVKYRNDVNKLQNVCFAKLFQILCKKLRSLELDYQFCSRPHTGYKVLVFRLTHLKLSVIQIQHKILHFKSEISLKPCVSSACWCIKGLIYRAAVWCKIETHSLLGRIFTCCENSYWINIFTWNMRVVSSIQNIQFIELLMIDISLHIIPMQVMLNTVTWDRIAAPTIRECNFLIIYKYIYVISCA